MEGSYKKQPNLLVNHAEIKESHVLVMTKNQMHDDTVDLEFEDDIEGDVDTKNVIKPQEEKAISQNA